MTAPGVSPRFPVLEERYGPLVPMDSGMQSRVFAAPGGVVVKVYRNHQGHHRLEADNMLRAGLGDWVIDAVVADGVEALVLRRFAGRPLQRSDVLQALPQIHSQLTRLHGAREGWVNLQRVEERLHRFRTSLAAYPLGDLFDAVERALDRGLLRQPAAFCHLDLWYDNILMNRQTGEVLIIDWTKAACDDPLRDLALLKTGTLDLLPADESLAAALSVLPDQHPDTLRRYRAYLALTTLHDLYWFLMNEPYEFDAQREKKVPRARHALARLPEV